MTTALQLVTVRGRVIWDPGRDRFADAEIVVRIEDASYADRGAELLWEARVTGVPAVLGREGGLPFQAVFLGRGPGREYVVRAHIDVDRDGRPGAGDYLSVQRVLVGLDLGSSRSAASAVATRETLTGADVEVEVVRLP